MSEILNIVLELVRSGPAHNQLLSPLTTYVALCGGGSPGNVHLPFEHHQLLMRIQRLRYELETGPASEAQTAQRQAELREMGDLLGAVLGEIPALLTELSRARSEGGKLVHLRLSLSAGELGMVPFETAISPAEFPGTGSPLFLQSLTPVTITREIRRGRLLPLEWNRTPNILFAFASPPGLREVPAEAHLKALREAIDPWVKIKDDPRKSVHEVKKLLTVLPDASLQDIRDQCAKQHYTHLHILAHGAPFSNAGDKRFGVALCRQGDKTQWDVVDGGNLAIALTGKDASGATQFNPTLVSLATCDSGNVGSVLTPGGSIAHELHAAGIPWVVASQFPLWMRASTLTVRELFRGLLEGEDPRWVLHGLRQKLRTDCPATHDWASIVAYATLPADFEKQVEAFRDRQIRSKLEVQLNRLDDLFAFNRMGKKGPVPSQDNVAELETRCGNVRDTLTRWRDASPTDGSRDSTATASERLGMSAAYEKRLGIAYWVVKEQIAPSDSRYLDAYRACREFYRRAVEADPSSTWVVTQYLSISAIPPLRRNKLRPPFGIDAEDWWFIALQLAKAETQSLQGSDRAYALTNLAELHLLGSHYANKGKWCWDRKEAEQQIKGCLDGILQLKTLNPTPVIALERQLWRYRDFWYDPDWDNLAEAAIKILRPEANPEDTGEESLAGS